MSEEILSLSIETSTNAGSIALITDRKVISKSTLNIYGNHSAKLIPALNFLIKSSKKNIQDVDFIAVSIGPGSFTGLRVGLSTAKGLAFAQDLSLVTVPTLRAFARQFIWSKALIAPILDAKKREVYSALFRANNGDIERVIETEPRGIEDFIEMLPEDKQVIFTGNGVDIYKEKIQEKMGTRAQFPEHFRSINSAVTVGEIGLKKFKAGEIEEDINEIEPKYLRKSEAERNWEKKKRR